MHRLHVGLGVFEHWNVLNSHNPAGYYTSNGIIERVSLPNLPFMPTFGVSIAY